MNYQLISSWSGGGVAVERTGSVRWGTVEARVWRNDRVTSGLVVLVHPIRIGGRNGGAGVGSVVGWSDVIVRWLLGVSSSGADGGELSVPVVGALVARKESSSLFGCSGSVAIGSSISLLLLVVPDKEHLDDCGEEEEADQNEGHDEDGPVETARAAQVRPVGSGEPAAETETVVDVIIVISADGASAQRRRDNVSAPSSAFTSEDGNCDEATDEEEIQEDAKDAKGGHASEEAGQEDAKQGVENGSCGDGLDGDDSARSGKAIVPSRSEEVGEDAENESGGEELNGSKKGLKGLQTGARLVHHGCCRGGISY